MKLTWHCGEPPKRLRVRQVNAIGFNKKGEILLRIEHKHGKKSYLQIGGTPEEFDADRIATLKREYLEEANTTLKDPIYLAGYVKVDEENGIPPYAQLRMVAMIDKVGKKRPDPDTGETYDRVYALPEDAIKLLNWGEIGELQIREAYKIAKEKFNIK